MNADLRRVSRARSAGLRWRDHFYAAVAQAHAAGHSQTAIAQAAGVGQQYVSKILRNLERRDDESS